MNRGSHRRRRWLGAVVVGLLCLGLEGQVHGGSPVVTRVEPPSWWLGHSQRPVRLLVSGEHLAGAHLEAPTGFDVGSARVSENGDYMFVDLHISDDAQVGVAPLRMVNEEGEARVPFKLLPALSHEGRFQGFSTDDVIYLLMPDRFANGDPSNDEPDDSSGMMDRSRPRHYHGGDLQGVLDRLDYLRDLGVTTLWLTPWYDNADHLNHFEKYSDDNKLSARGTPSTDYHGYGTVDFYAVEEHFGDLSLLRQFVSSAQATGLKVVQDQVANHTGPSHYWSENPPTSTWYNGTASNHLANSWEVWTTVTNSPPPDKLKSTLQGWFIDILPDLNQNDPEVATYLIQNSLWWVGMTGVDAVRQDTLPYVPRKYWAQWTSALRHEFPDVTILGELWDSDPKLVSFFQGGQRRFDGIDSGVDTLFDFPLYYAIQDVFAKGHPMTRLTETLAADTNYVDATVLVTFLGLHDTARFLNEPGADIDALQLAFTFLLTARGTPLIYYGDEVAMRGGGDPHNRKDFPGGWADDEQNAFAPSGRTQEQQEVRDHVSRLLQLRRETDALRGGTVTNLQVDRETYAFARTAGNSLAIVALNKSTDTRRFQLSLADLTSNSIQAVTDRLGALGSVNIIEDRLEFMLPPKMSALFTSADVVVQAYKSEEEGSERPSISE